MRKLLMVLVSFTLFLTSCGNKPKERAEELCECLKKDGLTENSTLNDAEKIKKNLDKNALQYVGVLADIQKDMRELDNDDRGDYVKTFIQALLDTDCMGIVLNKVPYDDILKLNISDELGLSDNGRPDASMDAMPSPAEDERGYDSNEQGESRYYEVEEDAPGPDGSDDGSDAPGASEGGSSEATSNAAW